MLRRSEVKTVVLKLLTARLSYEGQSYDDRCQIRCVTKRGSLLRTEETTEDDGQAWCEESQRMRERETGELRNCERGFS